MPVNAVIRVGDGRSFIVKDAGRARFGWRNERVVITAAHCLPFFPVGDIAVLGKPDDQVLFEQCTAYEALMMAVRPLRIADAREEGSAQLLSLEGANGLAARCSTPITTPPRAV